MDIKKFKNFENNNYVNSYEFDGKEFEECLPYLKKVNNLISRSELINWFNENDIDYFNKTDIEMYIYYIENNL